MVTWPAGPVVVVTYVWAATNAFSCLPGDLCAVAYRRVGSDFFEYDTFPNSTIKTAPDYLSGGPTVFRSKAPLPGPVEVWVLAQPTVPNSGIVTTVAIGKLYLDGKLLKEAAIATDNYMGLENMFNFP